MALLTLRHGQACLCNSSREPTLPSPRLRSHLSGAGLPLPRFLRERLFTPLGMTDTTLGEAEVRAKGAYAERREAAIVLNEQTEFMALNGIGTDASDDDAGWNWNSEYWRTLGAPWGGRWLTTALTCLWTLVVALSIRSLVVNSVPCGRSLASVTQTLALGDAACWSS